MRKLFLCLVIPALLALPTTAAAGELKLTMNGGLVTLIADDVPLSAILAEWSRVGQTKFVNGEQLFTRVTLQIVETPERKALDIVLRSAAGYMAAQRAVPMAGASAFDRVMILPTSQPPANAAPIMPAPPAAFVPRPATPAVPQPDVDDDPTMVMPPGQQPMMQEQPPMPGQPGVPGQQPAVGGQQPPGLPGQQPPVPMTSPRPGQLPAPPQQPVPFGTQRPTGGPGGVPTVPPTGPGGVPRPGGGGGGVYEPDR